MARRPPTPTDPEPPPRATPAELAEGFYARLVPRSRVGWWALGGAGAFVALNLVRSALDATLPPATAPRSTLLPAVAGLMLAVGLAVGAAALVAVRRGDRYPLLFVPLLAGLFSAIYLLGQATD